MRNLVLICLIFFIHSSGILCQYPGGNVFTYDGIHDIRISFDQENFWDSLLFYKEEGDLIDQYTYMVASVDFNGKLIDSTGVRLKGNSSYWGGGNKKSIKLKFNEFVSGQKLDGLKKINLNNNFNDPTLMREKLFLDMLQRNGVPAPKCAYARVYLNGVYWGLYTMVDHVDKVFLLTHFNDKTGNLYKGDKDPGLPCADLSFHQDPWEYRNCYTRETNEISDDWSDLEELIYVINHAPLSNYSDALNPILNASSFINAWAANIAFVNVDSYVETGHNYYIYHNPRNDKFEWITWDVNEAFGLWNVGMPLDQLYNLDILYLPPDAEFTRPLSYFMLQDPVFRKMYLDKVYDLVQTELTPELLFPEIDRLYSMIKEDVYLDSNKILSNQDFEINIYDDVHIPDYPGWVPGLMNFIQYRHDVLTAQLSDLGYRFTDISDPSDETAINSFHLYSNPATNVLNIDFFHPRLYVIECASLNGQLLYSTSIDGLSIQLDLSPFQPGVYFITIRSEDFVTTKKIIKL